MFPSFIVVFREILEVAVILSVVLAATVGLKQRGLWIWLGLILGCIGSATIAMFTSAISNFADGLGQELFNAMLLFTASGLICWTAIWMGTHAKQMMQQIKEKGSKIVAGDMPKITMTVIIALAVLREGAEIVLFTHGMLLSGKDVADIIMGSLGGLVVGAFVGFLIYFGIISISTKYIFRVTTWLLILLSAGMASVGAKYLVAAGYFSQLSSTLFDLSWLLSESSVLGQILHAMFGYAERPMEVQVIFYLAIIVFYAAVMFLLKHRARQQRVV